MANPIEGIQHEIERVPRKERLFVYAAVVGIILFVIIKARQNAARNVAAQAQAGAVPVTAGNPFGLAAANPATPQTDSLAQILAGMQAELGGLLTGQGASTVGNPNPAPDVPGYYAPVTITSSTDSHAVSNTLFNYNTYDNHSTDNSVNNSTNLSIVGAVGDALKNLILKPAGNGNTVSFAPPPTVAPPVLVPVQKTIWGDPVYKKPAITIMPDTYTTPVNQTAGNGGYDPLAWAPEYAPGNLSAIKTPINYTTTGRGTTPYLVPTGGYNYA